MYCVLSEKTYICTYADFPMNGEIERPLGITCQGTMKTNLNIHFVKKAAMSEWMVYIHMLPFTTKYEGQGH